MMQGTNMRLFIIIFALMLASCTTTAFSSSKSITVIEPFSIKAFYEKLQMTIKNAQCDSKGAHIQTKALIDTALYIERIHVENKKHRINQHGMELSNWISKAQILAIKKLKLKFSPTKRSEQYIVCINDQSAYVINSKISNSQSKSLTEGKIELLKYKFNNSEQKTKIEIQVNESDKTYTFSKLISSYEYKNLVGL